MFRTNSRDVTLKTLRLFKLFYKLNTLVGSTEGKFHKLLASSLEIPVIISSNWGKGVLSYSGRHASKVIGFTRSEGLSLPFSADAMVHPVSDNELKQIVAATTLNKIFFMISNWFRSIFRTTQLFSPSATDSVAPGVTGKQLDFGTLKLNSQQSSIELEVSLFKTKAVPNWYSSWMLASIGSLSPSNWKIKGLILNSFEIFFDLKVGPFHIQKFLWFHSPRIFEI